MHLSTLLASISAYAIATASAKGALSPGRVCEVPAHGDGRDDSAAILEAFDECGQGGTIIFANTTYHVERVLNTTGLNKCKIELKGTLLV